MCEVLMNYQVKAKYIFHSNGNHQQHEKVSFLMGEGTCQW